jgi:hypothetical protein
VLAAACLLLAQPSPSSAAPAPSRPLYTISIGQNEIPAALRTPGNAGLTPLRYADDDAAYFHQFMRDLSRRAYLLAVLDADTQQRFPTLARDTRVPARAELEAVVAEVKAAMERDRAAGAEPVLLLFYSGHGLRDENGAPGLALEDGALSQAWLYDELLARLPARFAHVIVDACHAEAVVRPRDAEGHIEALGEGEQRAALDASTLARFPHVGAILASTAGAQSFEWDAYRGGVFAHEVLSGLRGAADVNGDGQIEYSELAAFVAAANLEVADPRVRPQVIVQPPRADRRAPIVDLTPLGGLFRLHGEARGAWAAPFFVENENGVRLLDAFPEPGATITYRFPADRPLYVVTPAGEVALAPAAGGEASLTQLAPGAPRARPRGALETSMRKGLFATAYGPSFYRGYVSRQDELVPVTFPAEQAGVELDARTASELGRQLAGRALLVGAGVSALAAGVFGALTWNARSRYDNTQIERQASDARADYDRFRKLGLVTGGAAVVLGAAGAALLWWPRAGAEPSGPRLDGVAFTGAGLTAAGSF